MSVPGLPSADPTRETFAPGVPLAAVMRQATLGAVGSTIRILATPNEPFFLRHHPANWRVSKTLDPQCYLPEITAHVIAPGVNGCRTRDEGEAPEMSYKASVRSGEDHGWSYLDPMAPIPPECLPSGVASGGYLRVLSCEGLKTGQRGDRHVEAWAIPTSGLPDEGTRFPFHKESYEKWLKFLVESGQIAPMDESVRARFMLRKSTHLAHAQNLQVSADVRDPFIARKQAICDAYANAENVQPLAPPTADDIQAKIAQGVADALAERDAAAKPRGRK